MPELTAQCKQYLEVALADIATYQEIRDRINGDLVISSNTTVAYAGDFDLSFSAVAGGSETTTLGAAVRAIIHIPDIASWAPTGNYCAGDFEIYSDGSTSDPNGATELSFLRFQNSGDSTGMADVDTDAFFIIIKGLTAGATDCFSTGLTAATVNAATTASLKCKVGSTTYYIPLATAIA